MTHPHHHTALTTLHTFGALGAFLLVTLTTLTASAGQTRLYDVEDDRAAAIVVSDQGVIFLHQDGAPYRAFTVAKNTDLHVTELDQDGRPDIIGLGKPMFALSGNASPMWVDKKGCKSAAIADIVADDKLDIACTDGKELKVYTHDMQFVWGLSIGKRLSKCRAGDTNGDQKAEVECSVGGKRWARFESSGKLIDAAIDEPMIDADTPSYTPATPKDDALITKKTLFDFDKNGTPEEYLAVEDGLLLIKSKALDKPLAMTELDGDLKGVMVKDLAKDGVLDVIAITNKSLIVLSSDGKTNQRYSLKAKSYKRKPMAELQSVYANGFDDNDAAKKGVVALQGKLDACYASQLKKTQFAGSGQMLIEIKVDGEGKVSKASTLHSEIADKKVAKCAIKHLKKISIPKPTGDSASINVTILYTFRDQ